MAGVIFLLLPFELLKVRIMNEENKELIQENNEIHSEEYIEDELSFDNAPEVIDLPEEEEKEKKPKKNFIKEMYEWISSIAVAVVLALIINTFLFSLVQVDGQSMVPTLQHGERLFVRKLLYTPEKGDVVIVKTDVLQKYIVKRVIGTPGQTINYDESLNVTVDGEALKEEYINAKQITMGNLYDYPVVVPKAGEEADISVIVAEAMTLPQQVKITEQDGKLFVTGSNFIDDGEFVFGETQYTRNGYFVMGDNRNHSSDSRNLGIVPEDEIIGEAIFRFLPISAIGTIK